MIYKVNLKGIDSIDSLFYKHIDKYLSRINKFLPYFAQDLPLLNLTLKKNRTKYSQYNKRVEKLGKNHLDKKKGIAQFEGLLNLRLPKKIVNAYGIGQSAEECINCGFKHLLKEIKKYKELHFKSHSKYPNQQSIRR